MKTLWPLALVLASGCLSPLRSLTHLTPVSTPQGSIVLHSNQAHGADVTLTASAVETATPGLERWGQLPSPVQLYLLDSHGELEWEARRFGFGWLRAWSRFDEVLLQRPSSWGGQPEVVAKLLLHELTHCLTFQRSGTVDTWRTREIPLWFREGMALVTAGQQLDYPSLEDTSAWLRANPSLSVFDDAERLSRDAPAELYGLAVHAFTFFIERYGEAKVMALLDLMRLETRTFREAFEPTVGSTLESFERDLLTFLKFRAFRGNKKGVPRLKQDVRSILQRRPPPGD